MGDSIQPSALSEDKIVEYRSFVEWILEIDLTQEQEGALRKTLTEEWAENDRETMALVEANLGTFRAIQALDEASREAWRKQNQPTFITSLEKHVSSDLGTSLLEAFHAAHPSSATSDAAEGPTPGELALGLLSLAGVVAIAALASRAKLKRDVDEAINRDNGKGFAQQLGNIFEARKREVEELSKSDPAAAAMKALEHERLNRELIDTWMNTNVNISRTIASNMTGGWRWSSY